MPKYDFRCDRCGSLFELTRSFSQSADPAACPHDGASATRLFSPPMDLLMYRREPVVDTRPLTIPPGALSCHDHGPPAGAADGHGDGEGHSGSRWHANGYEGTAVESPPESPSHGSAHGHSHAHGHGHSQGYGHGHSH